MPEETASPPQIKITWLIGTVVAFALFAIIGSYSARMSWDYADYDQQRADQRYQTLAKVRHDEGALISTTAWVDQDKGVVRIPIEDAMAREIDVLKAKPAQAGAEIPGAAPTAASAPVPAMTNAAPIAPTAPAKPVTPAKQPKAAAKPVKTTLLQPGQINQPVFNTRKINTQPGFDTQSFKGFITYGGVSMNPSANPAAGPAAATSN